MDTTLLLQADPDTLRERFLNLKNPRDVAELLEVRYSVLTYLIYRSPSSLRYVRFDIPKRHGGYRPIMAPNGSLKILQSKLNKVLAAVYKPKPSAQGFVLNRSVVTNAQMHCKRHFVFNLDLIDFFQTINFGRVRGMFIGRPYNMSPPVATVLAQICCFDNQLPQGAPTSPIVSNMVCRKLDSELQRLAEEFQCIYSRYADDITFSTHLHRFPEAIARLTEQGKAAVGDELKTVIESNGFLVNQKKVFLQRWDSHQEVTGLTVNRKPNIQRRFVRQIRAMLHAWTKYGLQNAECEHIEKYRSCHRLQPGTKPPSFERVVQGKIAYLAMVRGAEDPIYRRFVDQFNLMPKANAGAPKPEQETRSVRDLVRDALWILECEESATQGTAFALKDYGLITCAHVLGPRTMAFRPGNVTTKYPITVTKKHDVIDLAIIKIGAHIDSVLEITIEDGLQNGSKILVGGFPNYRLGDTGTICGGQVVGHRMMSTIRRALVDAPIVVGNSGGPVVDEVGRVVGVAVTGAEAMEKVKDTEKHGVIPISALSHLLDAES